MSENNTIEKYDAIIIGSGLGGLLCANTLSMEGQKVLVLEKNNQLGGNLQIFVRDGVLFDTGVHYIGGLKEGCNLNRIFHYHGIMRDLMLEEMDSEGFDVIRFTNETEQYCWAAGYPNFIKYLVQQFPEEEKAIEQFVAKVQDFCRRFPLYNLKAGELNQSNELLTLNAKQYIESITSNTVLREVLAGNSLLYAGDPDKTPFYVLALVCNSYIESAHKIKGGGGQIAQLLAKNIRKLGGKIKRYQEVNKILTDKGQVIGVQTKNFKTYYSKKVISNAHPLKTFEWVDQGIRKVTLSRLRNTTNTVSSFSAHIVLEPNTVRYFRHNIYHFQQHDVWNNANYTTQTWPKGIMISCPSERQTQEFAKGISLLAYMNAEDTAQWNETKNTVAEPATRSAEYEQFCKEKAQKMIEQLIEVLPEVEGNIKAVYTSSPLTFRDYIGSPDGSMYGILNDNNQPLATMLNPTTRINGLYLTGQNLNLHGILGVSMSALKTCGEILGMEYLLKKVNTTVH